MHTVACAGRSLLDCQSRGQREQGAQHRQGLKHHCEGGKVWFGRLLLMGRVQNPVLSHRDRG